MFLNNIDGDIQSKWIWNIYEMYLYYDPTLTIRPHTRYQSWYGCYLSGGADSRCSHGFFHWRIHHHVTTFHSFHSLHLSDSWNLDFWNLESEWAVLVLLELFESLLLELLFWFQGVGVGSANAEEVSPEERDSGGEEQGPDDEGFFGLLVVALVWGSNWNIVVFVAPEEVAGIPNTKEAWGVNHELAGNEKLGSGWVSIFGIVRNVEADSNEEWHKENDGNKYVPPGKLFVKEAPEDLNEKSSEQCNGKDTNSNDTALNWEATAAGKIFGLFDWAVANAAATEAALLLDSDLFKSKLLWWLFFLHKGHTLIHHFVGHYVILII